MFGVLFAGILPGPQVPWVFGVADAEPTHALAELG